MTAAGSDMTAEPAPDVTPIDQQLPPVADRGGRPGKATTSLVLGIVGLLVSIVPLLGFILGITAVVKGAGARDQIRDQRLDGVGTATAGLVLGVLAMVASVAWIIFAATQR
jgi:hypothetical protein